MHQGLLDSISEKEIDVYNKTKEIREIISQWFHNGERYENFFFHFRNLYNSGCVSMGSMGSVEPMEFWRWVPEPMDFEQIDK